MSSTNPPPIGSSGGGPTPQLRRSRTDRVLGGVLGGMALRWGLSATGLRIVFVAVSVLSAAFPGIIVYAILWALIPEE